MKDTKYSGKAVSAREKHPLSDTARLQIAYVVGGVLLGFLLPRATVYGGASPFGIGLVAAVSGPGAILIGIAVAVGYLLQGEVLQYLAAIVAVVGIRWSVGGFRRVAAARLFPSVVAFLASVVTSAALLSEETLPLLEVLSLFSEGLLAGGFAFFAATVGREMTAEGRQPLSREAEVSLVVIVAVAMMALFTVEFGGIAPARVAAQLLILIAARIGNVVGGTAGIVFGAALLLSTPQYAFLVPAYALGGLLAGVFSTQGKWFSGLMLLVGNGIVTVLTDDVGAVLLSLYEAAAACAIFWVLPPVAESAVERLFRTSRRLPEVHSARREVALKMERAAQAMAEVAGTVDDVSARLAGIGAPDAGSVYHAAAEEVCRACRHRAECWNLHFDDVMRSLNQLTPRFAEQESVSAAEVEGWLADHCLRLEELVARINVGFREYRVRESAFRRLSELRAVVTDQFSSTALLLKELSEAVAEPQWMDVATARRVRDMLDKQGIRTKEVLCRVGVGGNMELEILLDGRYRTRNKEGFCRRVCELCGRRFAPPVMDYDQSTTRICFTESHTFRVVVGSAQLRCPGEQLCGDAYESFQDGGGRQLVVLSDGMGSGGRAAVDGALAARLAARLLKAGFGFESLLRLVNTALLAKSGDESLATLDVAAVNLFSGELELLKAGAGVSLLYSRGRVSRIDESSLPLGILRELNFARTTDRLADGDILIMMSDGVSDNGVEWVEELLRDTECCFSSMQGLAEQIAESAQERLTEKGDDVTVIALGVYRIR